MDLKKHLDRAESALERGQADFAVELCDQVLEFAPGDSRAAELLVKSLTSAAEGGKSKLLGKIGSSPAGLAAKFSRLTRNKEGEARSLRRAFIRNGGEIKTGMAWGDALERAGYAGAALGAYGALAEQDGSAAKCAGKMAQAQGEIDLALKYLQLALDHNPRDTEAIRARKNLAAEQALRTKKYEEAESGFDLAVDQEAFMRAARGEDPASEKD